ncbi:malonamoyl-CoA synthetase-like protein [Elsinoe australis]|uniref:Malonamoyl-CoA synthetase-like protein n=1 Tax=Elsinoe australis TaxID=40998 RepID=A0A4U7AW38_9PEZI|nr:malonamoyl-CoA synthetase-like protein [Elsinoe australis]
MNGEVKTNGAATPAVQPGTELWRHSNPNSTQLHDFMTRVNKKYGKNFQTYQQLYRWSIDDISDFWSEIWQYVGVRASKPYEKAISDEKIMFPRPAFFPGAELNFAENLLFPTQKVDPNSVAIISANEVTREQVTWAELRERVRQCQAGMIATGLQTGDRVGGFVANHTNALVAMLAATSLGAIWTAVSPDTGVTAVLDRMTQIEPAIFICDNAVIYNGRVHPTLPKVEEICAQLPSVKKIVILETITSSPTSSSAASLEDRATTYKDFCSAPASQELKFTQLQPDHPIYILYSSGTTGKPKPIVHGAIGTLLQHKKEHILQCDIRASDRLFYYSSTTWMMWHWLVSGLASGATLILYDGSPFRSPAPASETSTLSIPDDLAMPRLIDELKITHFGTSAKYLSILEGKSLFPRQSPHNLSLSTLRAIYSTGSPLAPSTFAYVYRALGSDLNLGSITGGTDIISLFGAPCPLTPVYCGEIQVLGLGMAVQAWDYTGADVSSTGEPGDLVCVKPFVCQPVTFWGPDGQDKYRSSYFEVFDGFWHHGDFVKLNPKTGGVYMLGRSDGILKPGGVRFGSAEIYNLVLQHFGGEVEDALCIGRRREGDDDETVVLFLKMMEGKKFDEELVGKVKGVVRKELSARHVPGIVVECPDIPITVNGKKVENAVKQILCGLNVKTSASVANAECLEWYREWARTHD